MGVQNRRGVSILFQTRLFSSLFFFSAARVFSQALFWRLLLHFSTSICTSFYSILLLLVRIFESFDLNGSIFDFKFVHASFGLKLCAILSLPFSFAFTNIVIVLSICLCFVVSVGFVWRIWVCLCCWFWCHHCGFGFGITTMLQEVSFYLL